MQVKQVGQATACSNGLWLGDPAKGSDGRFGAKFGRQADLEGVAFAPARHPLLAQTLGCKRRSFPGSAPFESPIESPLLDPAFWIDEIQDARCGWVRVNGVPILEVGRS